MYSQESITGIFPVNSTEAAADSQPSGNRNIPVFRFGNEYQLFLPQSMHCNQRIEAGDVIPDQQVQCIVRKLIFAFEVDSDMAEKQNDIKSDIVRRLEGVDNDTLTRVLSILMTA